MTPRAAVIGAGMGGLAAALRLARAGVEVRVLEARESAGGLASGFAVGGLGFDAGPYVLLDRPGLAGAFAALGLDLDAGVALRPVSDLYEVAGPGRPAVRLRADLEATAADLDRAWPGSGRRYARFVERAAAAHAALSPLLFRPRPGPADLLRGGRWRHAGFLLRALGPILRGAGLPAPLVDALAIWTHVAGQSLDAAPGPMAFVPALVHRVGAVYPAGGIGAVPAALARAAATAGVAFHFGTRVTRIVVERGRATGVETAAGERVAADLVVSNASGVGTYLDLVPGLSAPARARLSRLPLQSPGVCAYLAVRRPGRPPYLRFHVPAEGGPARLLIQPGLLAPETGRGGWWPARLVAPMAHAAAERGGEPGQRAFLERVLAEAWWREGLGEVRVLATRTPRDWGAAFRLHRDSMNPVMTARFMRAGRLPHRSPHARGLYLAGSATHPGQWVSFCAISGVLAAEQALADLPATR
jgi:1-hydroxycarotenoid 3,4-desaturase